MRKQITTWMLMLLCCASTTMAQKVATTPTAIEDMQDGYYVMVMRTADSRTDNTNGNFLYCDGQNSDKNVHFDEASAADHNLRGTTLAQNDFKYVFYVSKTDNKVSIKAYGTNYYWPAIPAAQKDESQHADGYKKNTPANWLDFVVSASAAQYDYTRNGEWFGLKCAAKKYTKVVLWYEGSVTATVNVNDETHRIGYWESGDKNICQFQIYAVDDMPEPGSLATVVYNYIYNGDVKKTTTESSARVGREYPDVDLSGLPDFLAAEKPAGTVTAEGGTFDIELKEALPFKTSTDAAPIYYYLENVRGDGTRLYASSGLKFRTAEQASSVNDVRNDLWYVKGNVFDGFQFSSESNNDALRSSSIVGYTSVVNPMLKVGSATLRYTDTWDLYANGEYVSVCPHTGSWYSDVSGFSQNRLDDSNKKNYSWKLNGNEVNFTQFKEGDASFAFRLVEPTFTFPMYPVGSNTYNSFAAPFGVEVVSDDIKMYKGALDAANKELVISPVDAAPINAGVVLMAEGSNAESVTLKAVAGAPALEGNDLKGTTAEIKVADLANILIFGMADDGSEAVGFFAANGSVVSLGANHAYLLRETVQQVKGVSIRIEGEPTSIGSISSESTARGNDAIYDLTGRRVARTQRGGLYIQNGRKFIVK